MPDSNSDQLAQRAADAVRQAIAEAESRAKSVVEDARAEAARIRERAEAEAREVREKAEADARAQIESAKRALDEVGGSLAAAVSEALPSRAESPSAPEAAPSPPAPEAPEPAPEAEQPAPDSQPNGGDAAERLVAMKLAVEGKDPAAIESELIEKFGPGDRAALLHEVVDRVSR